MPDGREINIRVSAKDETGGIFDKVREKLDKLKRVAGGRSTIKELAETLGGVGAVAGIAVAAEKMGELAKNAGEFAVSLDSVHDALEPSRPRAFVESFLPFGGTLLNISDGMTDLIGAIGKATGASEKFVESWESLPTAVKEAQKAISVVAHLEGLSDSIGAAGGSFQQRANDAGYFGKERIDLNQETREAQDAQTIRRLREGVDRDLSLTPDERTAMERNIDQAEKASGRAHAAERKRQADDDAHDRANQAMDSQRRLAAITAQGNETFLREHGKILEADLTQVRANTDAQIEQIKRLTAEQERQNPERTAEIDARKIQEIDAITRTGKALEDAATRRDVNERLEHNFAIQTQIKESAIEGLKIQAELGGQSAELDAERAEIAEKYREKRHEINRELREDVTLGAEQRDALKQLLAGLDDQEKKEKAIAAAKRLDLRLSSANTGRNVSGVLASEFALRAANVKDQLAGAPLMAPAAAGRAPQGAIAGQFRADWLNSQANSVQWAAAESVYGKGPVSSGSGAGSDPASSTAKSTATAADLLNQILTGIKTLVQAAQSSGQPQSIFGS